MEKADGFSVMRYRDMAIAVSLRRPTWERTSMGRVEYHEIGRRSSHAAGAPGDWRAARVTCRGSIARVLPRASFAKPVELEARALAGRGRNK